MIVFDEADKLLELGFEAEIKQIMSHTHEEVQTILFSATISKEINKLATITSKKPIRISADPDNVTFIFIIENCIKTPSTNHQTKRINWWISWGCSDLNSNPGLQVKSYSFLQNEKAMSQNCHNFGIVGNECLLITW